jgi:hypothetical protein
MPHIQFEKLPRVDLCTRIRPYHTEITKSAHDGNQKAKQIISLYRMYVSCPSDPGARGLCRAIFDDWLKERKTA